MTGSAIETRVGHTEAAEYRFYGHRVFAELLGGTNTAQMLMCSICGKLLEQGDMLIVDDIMTAMSSADARLWPFKIARLGATYGSTPHGVAATLVASRGAVFGGQRFAAIAATLVRWHTSGVDDNVLAHELAGGAVGFGVLYGTMDPRFDALMVQAEKRGRGDRPFASLAARAARISRGQGLEPHAFVAVCALALDLGLTPDQVGLFGMLPLIHLALAHATESAHQQAALMQRLPESDVTYAGPGPRRSARAQRADTDET